MGFLATIAETAKRWLGKFLSLFRKKEEAILDKPEVDPDEQELALYQSFLLDEDEYQKKGIVTTAKRARVTAVAGSGKTRVLTKRIAHLIKNKHVPASSILAITFGKKAAAVMKQRVAELVNEPTANNLEIKTFHKFCKDYLAKHHYPCKIIGNTSSFGKQTQHVLIKEILFDLKPQYMYLVYNYIQNYLARNVQEKHKEKTEKVFDERIKVYYYKTNRREWVRSKSERDIANFLNDLEIDYEYETIVGWGDKPFRPDFYIPSADMYIEHWGFNKNPQYAKEKEWKQAQFRKYGKVLIETNEEEMVNIQIVFNRIAASLDKHVNLKHQIESMYHFLERIPDYMKYVEAIIVKIEAVINKAKNNEINPGKLRKKIHAFALKQKPFSAAMMLDFYSFALPVYAEYEARLKEHGLLDLNDLLIKTREVLKKNADLKMELQRVYHYIFVDEYHDVSRLEVLLLKQMAGRVNNLFVVGDDWQSIYGFRGSNPRFFLRFEKDFGKCKNFLLPYSYRCSSHILDGAARILSENKNKTKRKAISKAIGHEKIQVYRSENDTDCMQFLNGTVKRLKEEGYGFEEMKFLYRNKLNINGLREKIKPKYLSTIHSEKGSEASVVFLLGVKGGKFGFPNAVKDDMILRAIKDTKLNECLEEERRCMYVGMTRAMKKLIIVTDKFNESEFISQIPEKCVGES